MWDFKNLWATLVHGPDTLYLNEDMSDGPKAGALFLQPPSSCYSRGVSTKLRAPSKPCPQHGWTRHRPKQLRSCTGVTADSSGRWSAQQAAPEKLTMPWVSQARILRTRQRASFCLCKNLSVLCLAYRKLFWSPHLSKDSLESGQVNRRSAKVTKGIEQLRKDWKDWDCPNWREGCRGGRCLSDKILWNDKDVKIRWMQSCYSPNSATPELRCTQWNFKA